ncbi:MAG: aldehyde dehydrogenase family protein [Bacteroidales bacterium]|nr:aldehyde dehydrogenase family protein [Bacteroidales bacterium]
MKSLKYIFCVPVVVNLIAVTIGSRPLEMISKPLLMPLIALAVYLIAKERDIRGNRVPLIISALLFGAVGDILLMIGGFGPFLAGMAAFLIGHIFYFSVLPSPWKVKGVSGKVASVFFLAILIVGILNLASRFPVEGIMATAVKVYACAFAFLIHASVTAAIDRKRPLYLLTALGFVIFAFSDFLVAIGAFTDLEIPHHGLLVMSTYILAQMIVAFSLLAVENHDLKSTEYGVRAKRIYALWDAIKARESDFVAAFEKDFGKGEFETYTMEIGFLYNAFRKILSHMRDWMEPEAVPTPLVLWPAKSRIISEPYGKVLVIGPFNYPLHLVAAPLAAALSAGNTVVVKPSRQTPNVSRVLAEMLKEVFDPEVVEVIPDNVSNEEMLSRRYDYIFFTGSPKVGKIVMGAASKHLTPVTLELGGKSPAIVCESADVRLACERIAKGKFLNAGQTCVAPDYVLVHKSVHAEFISTMRTVIQDFFGDISTRPADMTLIATRRHFDRIAALIPLPGDTSSGGSTASLRSAPPLASLRSAPVPPLNVPRVAVVSPSGLVSPGEVVIGGFSEERINYISPTVIDNCGWDDPSMGEEIFGPVLPVIEYDNLQTEVIDKVKEGEKPLSLYIFTKKRSEVRSVLSQVSFGGGCVNETVMHIGNENLPFGGVGNSGMGAYHGKTGFTTFSHRKSILYKSSWLNFDLLKPPYGKKLKLIRNVYK